MRVIPKPPDGELRVVVRIYGEDYKVRGSATQAYVENIASLVDHKMTQIARRNPSLPMSKLAVLTALNLADELARLQEDYDNLVQLLDEDQLEEKK